MAGYSNTPLEKKLGIKDGQKVLLINAPENYFSLFEVRPKVIIHTDFSEGDFDLIHMFLPNKTGFISLLQKAKKLLKKDGALWISWPKKSSKMETDLNETIIRDSGLENGLVDIKVCAVDDTWSGLKLVYRVKDR